MGGWAYPTALIEDDDAAEIFGFVRIETFFHARVKAEKLRGNDERSEKGKFGRMGFQFEEKIGRAANGFGRAIADGDDSAAEFLHFHKNFTFGFHAGFAQKKREAG